MSCLVSTIYNPRFVLTRSVELVSLAVHVSVLTCILRQRSKGTTAFRSGFFTLYILQSIADIAHYILELVFLRLVSLGCVNPQLRAFSVFNVAYFLLNSVTNVQFAAHVVIAMNRLFVLTDRWTNRMKRIAIGSILLLSVSMATLRLVGRTSLIETKIPGVYAIIWDPSWVGLAASVSMLVYCVLTYIASIAYELRSLALYKRLTATAKEKYRNDFLLLVYALLQFIMQLLVTVSYGLFIFGALNGYLQLISVGQLAAE